MRYIYFLTLLISPNAYLHQAYTYDDGGEGALHVEFVINKSKIEVDTQLTLPFCWIVTLWHVASEAVR